MVHTVCDVERERESGGITDYYLVCLRLPTLLSPLDFLTRMPKIAKDLY